MDALHVGSLILCLDEAPGQDLRRITRGSVLAYGGFQATVLADRGPSEREARQRLHLGSQARACLLHYKVRPFPSCCLKNTTGHQYRTDKMSPTNLSFVVVICHGSYHTPQPYQPFLAALEESGIEAHCPQLPSSDLHKMNVGDVSEPDYDREPPPNGYPQPADDVKVVRKILDHLIVDTNKHVLLLGHSSGAFTATMAAIPELQAHMRKRKGAGGGIIGIFYECGFLIPVGESVHSFFQPKDGSAAVIPPYCQFHVG